MVNNYKIGPVVLSLKGNLIVGNWFHENFSYHEVANESSNVDFVFTRSFGVSEVNYVGSPNCNTNHNSITFQTYHFKVRVTILDKILVEIIVKDDSSLLLRCFKDIEEVWKMWTSHGMSINTHLLKEFAYEILPFGLQLGLMKNGASFIHASAFEVNGKALLLPAWGGVGKTSTLLKAVLDGKANFVTDDHAIIDSSGTVHTYTLPIHLYSYHINNNKKLKDKVIRDSSMHMKFQWSVGSVIRKKRLVRWVNPLNVFGRENISRSAKLEDVIVMFKSNCKDFQISKCTAEEAAIPCVGVISREINNILDKLAISQSGFSENKFPGVSSFCKQVENIYSNAFNAANCFKFTIPEDIRQDQVFSFLKEYSEIL